MDKPISSGLKITFLLHFIVALIFGVLMLFLPQVWGNLAGVWIVSHELYRLVGAAILAFGLSSLLAYRASQWESVRIVVLTEIFWTAMAAGITLYYLVRWYFPPLYWVTAILMAGFSVAFIYFYLKNKSTTTR